MPQKQKSQDKKAQAAKANSLFQRLQNPKNRNFLDLLEYNYIR